MKLLRNTLLATTLFSTALFAESFEQRQLYKDPTVMGMGGANVAIGGKSSAVFYNPAGLAHIPKQWGWEFGLVNLNLSWNENIAGSPGDMLDCVNQATANANAEGCKGFLGEMASAATTEKDSNGNVISTGQKSANVIDVIDQYLGQNFYF